MKHLEIIEMDKYFQDCYDLINEEKDYWKRFIITDKFEKIIYTVTEALESSKVQERKSLWIQGSYGTGKSHSTSVIKHLLWDDYKDVEGYLNKFNTAQIREKLKNFRKTKKVFPVVLKGVSNIKDSRSMNFVLQSAVKKALKDNGIKVETKSDFEIMIENLKADYINWDLIINNNHEVKMIANNKDSLIKLMEDGNSNVLETLEKILNERSVFLSTTKIAEWLLEVLQKLKEKNVADYIMIYWDEFTSVLELNEKNAILNEIQNIAELSKEGLYLYIISHKKIEAMESYKELRQQEKEKVKNRFHIEPYSMQTITTYHIIGGALNKIDKLMWEKYKKHYLEDNPKLIAVINKLSTNYSQSIRNKIKDIYPIHPYTAYLATFISKNIGSTERSIFKFLNDGNKGFVRFLQNDVDDEPFLTADYLWDFFIADIENDSTGVFSPIIDKYNLHISSIGKKGDEYTAIFKTILLLNTLHKMTMTSYSTPEMNLVIPHLNNIKDIFIGTKYEKKADEVLQYFDDNQIIHKTPEGLFEFSFSNLPTKEVENKKRELAKKYENVMTIFKELPHFKLELQNGMDRNIFRETEINFYWTGDIEVNLKRKLMTDYKKTYAIQIAIFLMRGQIPSLNEAVIKDDRTKYDCIEMLERFSNEPEFKDMVFILIDKPFNEKRYVRFINHIANSIVASNHNLENEVNSHQNKAEVYVRDWINTLKSGTAEVIYNGKMESKSFNMANIYIDDEVSKDIFKYGLENVKPATRNQNIWRTQNSTKSIEYFVFADTREYIEDKLSGGLKAYLKTILKNDSEDYIVNGTLEINPAVSSDHPTVKIYNKVKEKIEDMKGRPYFNLGDELSFLTKPPYGVYTNMVYMSLMGFVLRDYVGKLYESGTGKAIEKEIMRDKIVSLFKYWQEGKDGSLLDLRFGTEEEKRLIDKLIEIFNLESVDGLNEVRWGIRNQFIKKEQYPFWSLKYTNKNIKEPVKDTIDKILELATIDDREIGNEEINKILLNIENYELDLKCLVKPHKMKEGFYNFLKQIDMSDNNIKDDEITEVIDYLKKNMQEEIAFWEEEKVSKAALKWRIAKQSTDNTEANDGNEDEQETEQNDTGQDDNNGYGSDFTGGNSNEKSKLINKIKNFNGGIEEIKIRLIKMIEDNPEICKYFEENFN